MPYTLLIGLGAGIVSATVFASATTGSIPMRLILFLLTPLALFLAGLGLGPATAALAGIAGTAIVLAAGSPAAALIFFASQALPVFVLTYLASLSRTSDAGTEWYPIGRIVLAAALISGAFATLTLILLGGDAEALRASLRKLLDAFVTNELPKMPDAPTLTPKDIDEATAVALAVLPAASAISNMVSMLFNMWLAGRITLASTRLQRPWPDLATITYPAGTPLLLAVATGAWFLPGMPGLVGGGFAGPLFVAYLLLGLAVVHYVTRGYTWRPFALWALYVILFLILWLASLALALVGLTESIWSIRKMTPPRSDPPAT